jgi:4-hydroxy-3-methylbut-2-enyl diphosphate reductase
MIVVVGGRNSNNTLQLVAACEAAGRRVVHVERPEELRDDSFCTAEIVGITAGTSTLPETVTAVVERLQQLSLLALNKSEQQHPK